MFRGNYKAIISDIDGTLTPVTPHAFPSANVTEKIKEKVRNNGLIFCLATGRPFYLIRYLIEYLEVLGPCIVDNGAAIIDGKTEKVMWDALLPCERANAILQQTKGFGLVRVSLQDEVVLNPTQILPQHKVRKISIPNITDKEADTFTKSLETQFKDIECIKATSYKHRDLTDLYISDIHATKQHAVIKLAEILKLNLTEIVGVGDHYNDFPLLMACGFKVAMGNAVSDLKAIADYIAPSVEDDGLADVLDNV